jgi:hypothetical protein
MVATLTAGRAVVCARPARRQLFELELLELFELELLELFELELLELFELELFDEFELELLELFELELLELFELELLELFELELFDEFELELFDEFELELSADTAGAGAAAGAAPATGATTGAVVAAGAVGVVGDGVPAATTTLHHVVPFPVAIPTPIHWNCGSSRLGLWSGEPIHAATTSADVVYPTARFSPQDVQVNPAPLIR